jgi:hypothetical protein
MNGVQTAAIGMTLVAALFSASPLNAADTAPQTIAALAGEWSGDGTDRNSAAEQATPVSCRASNNTNGDTIHIKMSCDGAAGREDITARLKVDRAVVSGSMTRKSPDLPFTVSGSVSGRTNGTAATFDVRAFFKTRARITVALLSRSLYRLLVTDPEAGTTLMKVTFRKG